MWRQQERLGQLAWRGPDRSVMLMAARGQTGAIAAVFGAPYPLTGEAIADAGGALESDLAKRAESYVQASSPETDAPALWFDTSNPSFLTIKIQRG
jgi:hypothetical protein